LKEEKEYFDDEENGITSKTKFVELNNKEKTENIPMTIYGMNNNITTTCLIPSTNIVKQQLKYQQ